MCSKPFDGWTFVECHYHSPSAFKRGKLILAGFTDDIDALTTKQDSFATKACSGVRKGGGLAATVLSIEMEEDLVNMVRW